jgi:NADH-quinone oxidoreductase subunit M
MQNLPWLSLLILLPLFGAVVLVGLESAQARLARRIGIGFSGAVLVLAIRIGWGFNPQVPALQFVERYDWIPVLNVQYFLGVDGLGLLMVLLTAVVVPFALLASQAIAHQERLYYALTLLLQAGLLGTFTALNFFHWFLFWELSLIPAFFLIRLWGGPQRASAATQFFLYTLVGSVAMLLSFQAIFLATGTFDFIALADWGSSGNQAADLVTRVGWLDLSPPWVVMLVFAGVFLGFAVKVPIIPFHSWLPAAYAEAPTGTTMILTGVMSKMGVYGFLRVLLPIFPQQTRMILLPLLALAVVTIVYGAWTALAQRDLKRLLAYSSINHLGYCLLGLFAAMKATGADAVWISEKAAALDGVLLQMFNHGITAAALFCFVGYLEIRGRGRRGLDDFGGLRRRAPVLCGLMGIALFASLGLPGLNGFVGEFLIFKGVFALAPVWAVLALLGLLLTAILMLNILQHVFSGPLRETGADWSDLTGRERWIVMPVLLLMLSVGLYPAWVLHWVNPTVLYWVSRLNF